MNSIELLAPAGSFDMAKAVIAAGADAVYFAGRDFGARAYAANLDPKEAEAMIRILHLHGKKAYLTVNTLLKNLEMEKQLYNYLKLYYEAGTDAVLVQDFGVASLIREYFPGLLLHASTQMNTASSYGAAFLKERGFSRIVAARELSVDELSQIHSECDIEIEAFVHGALCVCYSGQCLMSSFLGGRSGNRGRCAQPCRLPYEVFDKNGVKLNPGGPYVLSPKDLCGIDDLPRLAEAGVCSLKIEGRMKQPAYAYAVTSIYRKYLDLYLENKAYAVSDEDRKRLLASGSRGVFTNAYFDMRHTPGMMSFEDSSHKAEADEYDPRKLSDIRLGIAGSFIAFEGEEIWLKLSLGDTTVTVTGTECQSAKNRPTTEEAVREKLDRLGEGPFFWQELDVNISDNAFIPLKEINELRRRGVDALTDKFLGKYGQRKAVKEFQPFRFNNNGNNNSSIRLYFRVTTKEQLDTIRSSGIGGRMILPYPLWNKAQVGDEIFELPVVIRGDTAARCSGFIKNNPNKLYEASSFDGLGLLYSLKVDPDHIYGGHRLYALSDRTKKTFGLLGTKVPIELSGPELFHRDNSGDIMLIYGRVPLMYMANCIALDCGLCKGDHAGTGKKAGDFLYLKDRKGKRMPVQLDCTECQNVIYNVLPVDLIDHIEEIKGMKAAGVEISFTNEGADEIYVVIERVKRALRGIYEKPPYEYTRGHFNKSIL